MGHKWVNDRFIEREASFSFSFSFKRETFANVKLGAKKEADISQPASCLPTSRTDSGHS